MRKSLFTQAQIIGILRQAEAGRIPTGVAEHHLGTEWRIIPWQRPDDLQLNEILGF